MSKQYLQETTDDWKTDYRVPCHTYIFENSRCIGYIKEGTTEELMFKKPSNQFDKRGRKFKNVTKNFKQRQALCTNQKPIMV